MSEINALEDLPYELPDDLTLAQFTLDVHHPSRPIRPFGVPWLIQNETGRQIGFDEIRTRVYGLANALSIKHGVQDDDVVCIFSSNHVDYPIAIWAVHRLGGAISAANPSYNADELEYQLLASKTSVIITHPGSLKVALEAARRVNIPQDRIVLIDRPPRNAPAGLETVEDLVAYGLSAPTRFKECMLPPGGARTKIAFLSFSSGTTGKPKAVAIPHFAPIANIIQMAHHHRAIGDPRPFEERRLRPGDTALAVLPFYHIYGLVVIMHWLIFCGFRLVVEPKFEYKRFLESIVKYNITHLFVVPPQVVLLCKHPLTKNYDLSCVRFIMSGAAPLSRELTEQLVKLLPTAEIGQGYGMTETCTSVSMAPISQRIGVMGSAGQLIPGIKARILKTDGSLAKPGEVGELVVTSPSNALCYANNEQATKETFIDGWVRTGDEVYIDEKGNLFVVDRLKEIMKVRGFQVAPAELEGHLLKHPDVADCCVVGVPDDYSGEVPLAFVSLEAGAAKRASSSSAEAASIKSDIAKWVADHKVAYKRLAGGVEFIDAVPKNPSGKLLRRLLRDKAKLLRAAKSKVQAKL